MDAIKNYIDTLHEVLNQLEVEPVSQAIKLIARARFSHHQVFILGNGGSASTAAHFVCDLGKGTRKPGLPPLKVIGLADNMAAVSAYANDEGYERVFAQQLAGLAEPGDVLIAISASGNSPNVVNAADKAHAMGVKIVAMTGFDGGRLGRQADIHIHVPCDSFEQAEDVHLMLGHLITKVLREEEFESQQLSAVSPSAYSLSTLESVRDVFQGILQLALKGVGASSGSILMLDENGEVQEGARAFAGGLQTAQGQEFDEIVEHGLAGWVREYREATLVPSTWDDPRWLRRAWDEAVDTSRSAISLPLITGGRVGGVLTLAHSEAGRFTQDDLSLLATITVCLSLVSPDKKIGR